MSTTFRILRKSYAMYRMARAIERAVNLASGKEQERAARWAAAWGLLCGINTGSVRLRRSDIAETSEEADLPASVQVDSSIRPSSPQSRAEQGKARSPQLLSGDGVHSASRPNQGSAP